MLTKIKEKLNQTKEWVKRKFKQLLIIIGILGVASAVGIDQMRNEVSIEKFSQKYEQATEIKAKYQLDNVSLIRTNVKNPELDLYKGEPKDEIKITLGDKDKQEFVPNIELKRWNEVSFKLKPKGLENVATKDKTLNFSGEKILYGMPKMSFEMYDVPATETDEGSYKYIWYLNEKPATNKIEFEIFSEGLDFFYQPPLTQQEIDEGAFRPPEVIGSYAVYHSTKGGMNDVEGKDYKVGKAFHIYRPRIIDASGAETWGILKIENGIYSVEIPQEFLDKAVYPIKSNDTFGNLILETGSLYINNRITGTPFTLSGNGTVNTMTIGVQAQNADGVFKAKCAIYQTNGTFVAQTNEVTNISGTTAQWVEFSFSSPPSLNAGIYVLVGWASRTAGTGDLFLKRGTISGFQEYYQILLYGSFPNPATFTIYSNLRYSIYATYTPSGGAAVEVIPAGIIIFE